MKNINNLFFISILIKICILVKNQLRLGTYMNNITLTQNYYFKVHVLLNLKYYKIIIHIIFEIFFSKI